MNNYKTINFEENKDIAVENVRLLRLEKGYYYNSAVEAVNKLGPKKQEALNHALISESYQISEIKHQYQKAMLEEMSDKEAQKEYDTFLYRNFGIRNWTKNDRDAAYERTMALLKSEPAAKFYKEKNSLNSYLYEILAGMGGSFSGYCFNRWFNETEKAARNHA